MRKRSAVLLCLICIIILLSGCVSDWIYELQYDYAISNNAYHTMELVKISERSKSGCDLDTVIGTYINEFSYNERYIAVKQLDPEKLDFENFELSDLSEPLYYLTDTVLGRVYGPYASQEEFDSACKELDVAGLCEWVSTRSDPNRR